VPYGNREGGLRMFLALPEQGTSNFTFFDVFMIVFTIILAIGLFRLVTAEKKNYFAIGFTLLALLTFLYMDYNMVKNWLGLL
jgi:hypothetical protein